jgi:hypothetical protein
MKRKLDEIVQGVMNKGTDQDVEILVNIESKCIEVREIQHDDNEQSVNPCSYVTFFFANCESLLNESFFVLSFQRMNE